VTAILVIDMQVGLFTEQTRRHDAEGVVGRINALGRTVRQAGGIVVFVQHDGPKDDTFEPGSDGWRLLPSLERDERDLVVHKRACDAFYETELAERLQEHGIRRLIVTSASNAIMQVSATGMARAMETPGRLC